MKKVNSINEKIINFLSEKGIEYVRFTNISGLPDKETQGFKYAIVFCLPLSKKFILDMLNGIPVHDEFLEKEILADETADKLANFIIQNGYKAYSQSEKSNIENGRYNNDTYTSALPHKTIARLAGLGFIGKSNLLVTRQYGSGFSMCTVLTDAPLDVTNPGIIPLKCGSCARCVKACPQGAITGKEWSEGCSREHLVDVKKCNCELKCMTACPWTQKYATSKN